jgi:hypothetical protein
MPMYDDGRRDDDVVEGELAPPATMIGHDGAFGSGLVTCNAMVARNSVPVENPRSRV